MILEISGDESTVEENINILSKFKVLELLRSGKMAMISGDQERNKPVLTRSEP
jgi:acetolactate synthase small subunit